jgi:hypothetical protein
VTIADGVVARADEPELPRPPGDYCYLTTGRPSGIHAGCAFSSLDANAALRDTLANLTGASAMIMRSTRDDEVYVGSHTKPSDARSCEMEP